MLGKMHKIVKQLLTPFIENQIFLYLKKLSENCSVNVPIELDTITRVTLHSLSYIHITQRYMHITQAILKCKLSM